MKYSWSNVHVTFDTCISSVHIICMTIHDTSITAAGKEFRDEVVNVIQRLLILYFLASTFDHMHEVVVQSSVLAFEHCV